MKINQHKSVQVDVTTLSIYCKVSDRFCYQLKDAEGREVFSQDDGYVPGIMPGKHYGDYIILDIDLVSGRVLNWKCPSPEQIEEAIGSEED